MLIFLLNMSSTFSGGITRYELQSICVKINTQAITLKPVDEKPCKIILMPELVQVLLRRSALSQLAVCLRVSSSLPAAPLAA